MSARALVPRPSSKLDAAQLAPLLLSISTTRFEFHHVQSIFFFFLERKEKRNLPLPELMGRCNKEGRSFGAVGVS
jgi:hypothetical protein